MSLTSMNVQSDDCCRPSGEYDASPCVYLTEEQCEALGLTQPPAAGTTVMVSARAVFQSVTQRAEGDDGPTICATLKLTDMELGAVGAGGASLY